MLQNWKDGTSHLAKVRVVGSNPVFRSKVAGQRRFFDPVSLRSFAEVHNGQ